jgi:hypothetical protein
MREYVLEVAGQGGVYDNRMSVIARAARKAGITFRQAKSLFYGEITDPTHLAARRMIDEANAIKDRREEKAASNELNELRQRLARLEHLLLATDPDFHRETVAALREQTDGLGGKDRPMDS